MTEQVEMTADEAEFIAECIATALPTDEMAAKYFAIADRIRATDQPDGSTRCSQCGELLPFGPEYLCMDCNGVRYMGEDRDWMVHHGCGFEEEWKYEREARAAIRTHLASCQWTPDQPIGGRDE